MEGIKRADIEPGGVPRDDRPDSPLVVKRGSRDVTVRYFRDGEEAAVLDLLQRTFPRWPAIRVSVAALEHLRWKLRLEESDERRQRIAEIDGMLMGFILGWTRPALLKGEPITISDGSDVCVHPDFHGRGVMGALISSGEESRRKNAFYLEGSTHPAVIRKRSESPEPQGVFGNRVERFVRPMTLGASISVFRLRRGRSLRKVVWSAWRFGGWLLARGRGQVSRRRAACTVREVTMFDERTDAFWQEASRPFDFIMVRDRAYLSWRYADRRGGEFTILIAEEGARLLGYTTLCTDLTGHRGFVADLLVLPERLDVAGALMREALTRFRCARAKDVECWLPERHPYRVVLDQAGFVLRRRKDVSAYRATGGVPEEELTFLQEPHARIHMSLGDIDRV